MSPLKSAYDLARERVISSRYASITDVEREAAEPKMDFVEIREFSDKEDVVLESNETKLIVDTEDSEEIEKEEKDKEKIKVVEPQSYTVGNKFMEVSWAGHFFDYGGFARMNRTMAFGLSNRGVKVNVEIEPYLVHVNNSTQKELRRMAAEEISPSAPKVFGVTVPTDLSHSGPKIIYTMIETSEKVHKDYAGKLNMMDEIWVPTQYGKDILKKSNVHPPIYVMPLGVDTTRYNPKNAGKMEFGSFMRKFVFLSVFRWSYRKGFDILLKAYMEEFWGEEDVTLLLVSRPVSTPEENGCQQILDDFGNIKSFVQKTEEELPHVALYTKPIGEKDMPKVYNSANAFVLISRGEGFCLPICEAASMGLPVISSNCSGQSDYLTEKNSYLVEPDGYEVANVSGNLSRMAKLCHFYEGQMFPVFQDKAIEATKQHMRSVYENYSEATQRAKILQKQIVNNYSWDAAVDRVYRRLEEIRER